MPNTTNYNWATPADSDLVKDGALAIRTLGSSVDTTVKNLNPETTTGAISYRGATANQKVALPIGTAGQVLTVNSGATAPEWATSSASSLTLINETVASSLSGLSISGISGSYKNLILTWTGIFHNAASNFFTLRLNNDSSGIYTIVSKCFDNTALSTDTRSAGTAIHGNGAPFGNNITSSALQNATQGFLIVYDYASTTKFKKFVTQYAYDDAGTVRMEQNQGVFGTTSAVTSIDVVRIIGSSTFSNATNTSIRLLGES
jgi:hypothetical protein